ncbi:MULTISPECIES: TetR/AcrR family transcriptional regulator [unclassified Micromonospora]|uniref:TetR/AcrR family transcriptional regulator n=1 Tax=unclassified Micromonospora TaxID=2617518 RepID=UPI001042AD9B|nr:MULTISPECIES: TetR/AcrR family transcriptional regulator [unclassified Micromonospora]TDB80617.1 TetR/AcrR family transcriptional regulator [Micromonospora sp. KC721]TDC42863.1 TetR/AcrR family transcriptional regulator [Micromonospora sp. KC213]
MSSSAKKGPVRRADASRNDARILAAARDVFTEMGSDAPVSVIAERAGVGMGTLYRRYPSKEDLMRQLSLANMEETRRGAETALEVDDAWAALVGFIDACVEAGVDGSPRLAGPFELTDELLETSRRARDAVQQLVERAQGAGVLRPDVNAHDIVLLLHTLRELRVEHRNRDPALRRRFLGIMLDGLRAASATPLPAPAATWSDVEKAWQAVATQ